MENTAIILVFTVIAYVGVGNFFANRYYRRRHGVRGKLGRGWAGLDAGWLGAAGVSITWPVSVFLPRVQEPELCRHRHHILARDEDRRRTGQAEVALRGERRS